jgi:hypothetical protein
LVGGGGGRREGGCGDSMYTNQTTLAVTATTTTNNITEMSAPARALAFGLFAAISVTSAVFLRHHPALYEIPPPHYDTATRTHRYLHKYERYDKEVGAHVFFDLDVSVDDQSIALDIEYPHITDISCASDKRASSIRFGTPAQAAAFVLRMSPHVKVMSSKFRCGEDEFVQVLEGGHLGGSQVHLRGPVVHPVLFFKRSRVVFSSNDTRFSDELPSRARSASPKGAFAPITGSLSGLFNFNYDTVNNQAVTPIFTLLSNGSSTATCTDCYAYAGVTYRFEVETNGVTFLYLRGQVEGRIATSFNAALFLHADSQLTAASSILLNGADPTIVPLRPLDIPKNDIFAATPNLLPTNIPIFTVLGIGLSVNFRAPFYGSLTFSVSGTGQASAGGFC